MKKKVSIVIPSWFAPNQHGKYGKDEVFYIANICLKRLIEYTPRDLYELIIIDNGSTLSSLSANPNKSPGLYFDKADILIRNSENLGFAPAMNQGINLARGEYVLGINNDIIVWEGWLQALLDVFDMTFNIPVGVIMPALFKQVKGFEETLKIDKPNLSCNYNKIGPGAEFGSCWLAPKKLLKQISFNRDGYEVYDENFKIGFGEDRWLWKEIRMAGYETYRTHKTRVGHVGNLTIGKLKKDPEIRKQIDANRIYLKQKEEEFKNDLTNL